MRTRGANHRVLATGGNTRCSDPQSVATASGRLTASPRLRPSKGTMRPGVRVMSSGGWAAQAPAADSAGQAVHPFAAFFSRPRGFTNRPDRFGLWSYQVARRSVGRAGAEAGWGQGGAQQPLAISVEPIPVSPPYMLGRGSLEPVQGYLRVSGLSRMAQFQTEFSTLNSSSPT